MKTFLLAAMLVWDYPTNETNGVTFNVYHKTNVAAPFEILTNVTHQAIPLPLVRAAEFFTVKAVKDGIESQ